MSIFINWNLLSINTNFPNKRFSFPRIFNEGILMNMIQPSEILTRDKERDADICNLFLYENLSMVNIGAKHGISHQAVSYILRNNKSLLKIDKEFNKAKRINVLERMLQETPEKLSKNKDNTDLIEQLRKEHEGDSVTNIISQFFTIRPPKDVKNRLTENIEQSNS